MLSPALIEALEDIKPTVRRAAADALGDLADPSSLPALRLHYKDDDDKVGQAAQRAVTAITGEEEPRKSR
jgi:HEAT repeat protein